VVAWPATVKPRDVVPPPIVVEPVEMRLARVVRPERTERVPEKEAADEMVCEFIKPEVMAPICKVFAPALIAPVMVVAPVLSAVAKSAVDEETALK
jgi:hypothetical protein